MKQMYEKYNSLGGGFKRVDQRMILWGLIIATFWVAESTKWPSTQKIVDVERKIQHLRRHIRKSIQSEDGDIIDCIDIYRQPAFDHVALRNHTIQMTTSYYPSETFNVRNEQFNMRVTQIWKKSGNCPKGTIPVRRIRKKELLKANSVEEYGRKKGRSYLRKLSQFNDSKVLLVQQTNHSKAILLTEGYSYSGGKGDIKVYNPNIESDDEYSTSQVCLINGPYYDYESIESGWAVNPSVYGDRQTRLFVYWTVDGSKTTGCFDLTCPGFVQTSHEIALGGSFYPISVVNGLPYMITIYIFKDPETNNWWVQYGESINIGYWPGELFSSMRSNAASVEWGGEVYSSTVGHTPHTSTGMGSGNFPDPNSWWTTSGFVQRIRIHDNSPALKFPEWVETFSDEYNCYDVYYIGDYIEDPQFYYGGPGRNPMCP